MNYHLIDPETWNRKEIFLFFKTFEEPYTGVVTEIDVTNALKLCRKEKISFFKYYLHKSIVAVNRTKALKLRLVNDEIRNYSEIHASATLSREDGTFGFSHIIYDEEFKRFAENVDYEKIRIQNTDKLLPPFHSENVVHYSSLPWIKFSSVSHARKFSFQDSAPKISFGKVHEDHHGNSIMNVSVHAHHALVDGKDIAEHLEIFQNLLTEAN